jgi:phage gp36-like protein
MPSYITHDELRKLGGSAGVLNRFSEEDIDAALDAASSEADCYLSAGYTTPLTTVPSALKMHVARAAVYHLVSARGFNPQGSDELLERNYDRAISFYKALQKSEQNMPEPPTSPVRDDIVHVVSTTARRERW